MNVDSKGPTPGLVGLIWIGCLLCTCHSLLASCCDFRREECVCRVMLQGSTGLSLMKRWILVGCQSWLFQMR